MVRRTECLKLKSVINEILRFYFCAFLSAVFVWGEAKAQGPGFLEDKWLST
jgi:hypothetical protein